MVAAAVVVAEIVVAAVVAAQIRKFAIGQAAAVGCCSRIMKSLAGRSECCRRGKRK